jgi:signal transduction histidine kinase
MTSPPPTPDLDPVLQRVAQGARLLGFGWWAALGVFTALANTAERPEWVVISIGLALAWMAVSVVSYRADPTLVTSAGMVAGDLVLAGFALTFGTVLSVGTDGTTFYGGMPILTVVVAAIRSRRAAWTSAITLATITGGDLTFDAIASRDVVVPVSQIFVYVLGAFIAIWALDVIRRSDAQIRAAAEALARSQERSRISEHLHDSVLQTLALIQKASDRPPEVVSLARRQERELREWLYGTDRGDGGGLGDLVRRSAADVEDRYGIPVEVVVVGDLVPGPVADAIAGAAREAMVNAAKHSGSSRISVYVEVAADGVRAFIRDRGTGFDPASVAVDRRGISDSIEARMQRAGGRATVRTSPDRGTEWSLEAPL